MNPILISGNDSLSVRGASQRSWQRYCTRAPAATRWMMCMLAVEGVESTLRHSTRRRHLVITERSARALRSGLRRSSSVPRLTAASAFSRYSASRPTLDGAGAAHAEKVERFRSARALPPIRRPLSP